jgi:AbrB family looped-hinge helix DNA binding protein
MKTTVSSKGQFVLPAELRDQDQIEPGQQFSIERIGAGEYLLKKLAASGQSGLAKWLLSCPEKDWFQPLDFESTDALSASIGGNSSS